MQIGGMSISGLISDLDVSGIITQLGQIRRRPVALLQQRQTQEAAKLTALSQLSARVLALSTACAGLRDGSGFAQVSAKSSGGEVAVSARAGAAPGSYRVSVQQLAQAHKVSSGTVVSADAALGLSGQFILGGRVITVAATDTLRDLRDSINAAGAGASASIVRVSDSDHRLVLSSLSTGSAGALELVDTSATGILEGLGLQAAGSSVQHALADGAAGDWLADRLSPVGQALGLTSAPAGSVQVNGVAVAIDLATDSLEAIAAALDAIEGVGASVAIDSLDGVARYRLEVTGEGAAPVFADECNVLVTLGLLGKSYAHEIDAAQDAQFTIDGAAMTRSSNAVDDALEGVRLQLVRATDAAGVTVTVSRDAAAAVSAVESLVQRYNSVVELIDAHQDFDAESGQGGLFFGSPAILSLEADLRRQVSGLVNALGGELSRAAQVGLSTDASDRLVFDSARFLAALQSDPVGVTRLFGTATECSDPAVAVLDCGAATRDSGATGWAVEITRPATRATTVSAYLAGGITRDEVLTVNGRQVALTAGMSLQDAADRLNALFVAQGLALSAAADEGRLSITHESWGAAGEIRIASSLDDGCGGTDLGGAVAGEVATVRGQDVAGTVNGEACSGRGRLLTGLAGNASTAGLTLQVSAEGAGAHGVVRVSKGIAARLMDFAGAVTAANTGSLTRAAAGVSSAIAAIDGQIADIEAEVDRYIAKLQADFAVMEMKMAQSSTLLQWLQQQAQLLPGMRRND